MSDHSGGTIGKSLNDPALRQVFDLFVGMQSGADDLHRFSKGQRIGKYELIERLGRGGFAAVWKARDIALGRSVAIKLLRFDSAPPNDLDEALREARVMSGIEHDNTVRVWDAAVDEPSNVAYIAMELCERSLRGSRMAPQAAAKTVAEICRGVAAAHARGVIHRDIKPANILVANDGRPKIADFGLARACLVGPVTDNSCADETMVLPFEQGNSLICGTPMFMCPEQARGETATPLFDVYSLGATLFVLLSGRFPYRMAGVLSTPTVGDVIREVRDLRTDPQPLPRQIADTLAGICQKAMAKSATARYQSVMELARDLENWVAHRPTSVDPPSAIFRFRLTCRRNAMATALILTAAICMVGFAFYSRQAAQAGRVPASVPTELADSAARHPNLINDPAITTQPLVEPNRSEILNSDRVNLSIGRNYADRALESLSGVKKELSRIGYALDIARVYRLLRDDTQACSVIATQVEARLPLSQVDLNAALATEDDPKSWALIFFVNSVESGAIQLQLCGKKSKALELLEYSEELIPLEKGLHSHLLNVGLNPFDSERIEAHARVLGIDQFKQKVGNKWSEYPVPKTWFLYGIACEHIRLNELRTARDMLDELQASWPLYNGDASISDDSFSDERRQLGKFLRARSATGGAKDAIDLLRKLKVAQLIRLEYAASLAVWQASDNANTSIDIFEDVFKELYPLPKSLEKDRILRKLAICSARLGDVELLINTMRHARDGRGNLPDVDDWDEVLLQSALYLGKTDAERVFETLDAERPQKQNWSCDFVAACARLGRHTLVDELLPKNADSRTRYLIAAADAIARDRSGNEKRLSE